MKRRRTCVSKKIFISLIDIKMNLRTIEIAKIV